MELRQLRYFTNVVELMSFSDAAKKLYISQSTLSQQIKQLEEELKVLFFNRNGKHISLTEAGALFYQYAKDCIQKSKDAVNALEDLGDLKVGEIRIGITYALRKVIVEPLVKFHKRYPKIKITVDYGSSNEMVEKLQRNEIDMLITFDLNVEQPAFQMKKLFETNVCFIVAKNSPLAKYRSISIEEISRYELIIQNQGFNTSEFIYAAFQKRGIKPNIIMEINDNPTLKELVKHNVGYSIMADVAVKNEKDLVGIPIEGKIMKRNVWAFSIKNVFVSKSIKAFYKVLEESLKKEPKA